jgi:hypothetical protein
VLDVEGFPAMRHWYVVHHRQKRLPPVALAFKAFLERDGATLIEGYMHADRRPRGMLRRSIATVTKSAARALTAV